jgi:diketogulonate reductase-like aldo/keto reductase
MKTISFPDGTSVPALGLGTWMMAEKPDLRVQEIAALREGMDLGMTLIDTAEMYGEGKPRGWSAKQLPGGAIRSSW